MGENNMLYRKIHGLHVPQLTTKSEFPPIKRQHETWGLTTHYTCTKISLRLHTHAKEPPRPDTCPKYYITSQHGDYKRYI